MISKHGFELKLIPTLIVLSWTGIVGASSASITFVIDYIVSEKISSLVLIFTLYMSTLWIYLHCQLKRNVIRNDWDGTTKVLKIICWIVGFKIMIILNIWTFLVMTIVGILKNRRIDFIKIQIIFL